MLNVVIGESEIPADYEVMVDPDIILSTGRSLNGLKMNLLNVF